jgi:hypothetical protein
MTLSGQVLKLQSAYNPGVKDERIIPVNMVQWLKKSSVIDFLFFILTDFGKKIIVPVLHEAPVLNCTVLYYIFHSSYLTTLVWGTSIQTPHT